MSGTYCAVDCRHTFWKYHGHASIGDVRRCEHGKTWRHTGYVRVNVYYSEMYVWERLGWWTPIAYRRALKRVAA